MHLRLLGPVHAVRGGERIDLGPAKQRLVLAALVGEGGRVVPAQRLIDRVWGATAPAGAPSSLYSYIARLRRVLSDSVAVEHVGGGYRIAASPDAVDLWQWEQRRERARLAEEPDRSRLLDEALALWNGPPLSDLDSAWADELRSRLERQREAMLTEWAELRLAAGDASVVARRLAQPVDDHPLAEGLVAAELRALRLAGRSAEALERYAQVRDRTIDELGVEPGPLLQAIYLELLRSDDIAEPERGAGQSRAVVPAQLPAAVAEFTGRTETLRMLDKLMAGDEPPAVAITVIAGTAGVGKTALAVHWAHRIADRFPDGQLWIDLDGYSANPPVDPGRALESMLRGLGAPSESIPADNEARAAMYRTRLAGRRVLVLLDNANGPDQVRPLIPGDPGCLMVITSRDALDGLIAVDGAKRIDLGVLGESEALDLLTLLVGTERITHEAAEARQLVAMCGRLPLALRIAAANVGHQPIADYLRALRADRLGELALDGDSQASVRVHFDHSYERLNKTDQRTFRLLGLVPGPNIDAHAVAALSGCGLADASRTMRRLANASLLQRAPGNRYTVHDLLRAYARQRAESDDDPGARDAALRGLYAWYVSISAHAVLRVFPDWPPAYDVPPPRDPVPALADHDAALAWLESERMNLVASIADAALRQWHSDTCELASTLWRYFLARGYTHEWKETHHRALDAARAMSDVRFEAEILHCLAAAYETCGQHPEAEGMAREALRLRREAHDRPGEARTLNGLGIITSRKGDFVRAQSYFEQGLDVTQAVGSPAAVADLFNNLGVLKTHLGHYADAVECLQRAQELFATAGSTRGFASALTNRGVVFGLLGRPAEGIASIEQSLEIHRSLGDRLPEALSLRDLGDVWRRVGRDDEATRCYKAGLRLAQEVGAIDAECSIRNGLGGVFRGTGDIARGLAEHQQALALTRSTDNPYQRARAHHGIARVRHDAAEHDAARSHWTQAAELYTQLGIPEAAELRAEIAQLDCACLADLG
jgi:DNA-binding SARP family transcriptional activator/tetratricopeptide (TPR) repeat protein